MVLDLPIFSRYKNTNPLDVVLRRAEEKMRPFEKIAVGVVQGPLRLRILFPVSERQLTFQPPGLC
jgi:hypothetical protein